MERNIFSNIGGGFIGNINQFNNIGQIGGNIIGNNGTFNNVMGSLLRWFLRAYTKIMMIHSLV